jgi:hypothetical protein
MLPLYALYIQSRNRIDFESKRLIKSACEGIAREKHSDDFEWCKSMLLVTISLRKLKEFPPYDFSETTDYDNYIVAIKAANLPAIKLFHEIGNNPFKSSHPFHTRLYEGDNSIVDNLKQLRASIQLPNLLEPGLHTQVEEMVQWLENSFSAMNKSENKLR